MDWDNIGMGAGGGLLSAILIALGFKSRMDKQDNRMDKLENTVMYKDTCTATHTPISEDLKEIKNDIKILLTRRRNDRPGE